MARSPFRRSLVAWLAGALALWSCASTPESGTPGHGGTAGGGARGGIGGSSTNLGGAGSNQVGGGGHAAEAGMVGGGVAGVSVAGTSSLGGAGTAPVAGMGSTAGGAAGVRGVSEGGVGGSDESMTDFDGRCGQGWAAGGSAPLPKLNGNVTPQVDSAGNWSFTFGRYRLVVAGAHGARIIEFSIDDNNLIDPTDGSTFWPSPQQAYPWPPPAEIDSAAYVAQSDATSLSLSSDISTSLGLSARKRFWVNATSGVVSIEYQLINQSNLSASWAPWEVTHVRAGGQTFAPRGPGNRTITQDSFQYPLPMTLLPPAPAANRIEWLNYPSLTLTQDNYISEFDGAEGWLAHADKVGKSLMPVLFVKSFIDAPDASLPPNQAEIQLWTSATANPELIEVEEQGALQVLLPGASLSWTVHWSACELQQSVMLSAGSADLAALARAHAVKP